MHVKDAGGVLLGEVLLDDGFAQVFAARPGGDLLARRLFVVAFAGSHVAEVVAVLADGLNGRAFGWRWWCCSCGDNGRAWWRGGQEARRRRLLVCRSNGGGLGEGTGLTGGWR